MLIVSNSTVLVIASQNGCEEIVKAFLKIPNININATNEVYLQMLKQQINYEH
jgi:hypothetical protein